LSASAIIRRGVDVEDDDCGDDDDDGNGEDNAPYETVRLPRKLNASSWTANNNAAISANIATKPMETGGLFGHRADFRSGLGDEDISIKGCKFGLF
jgi:hypothetical protein